MADGITRDEMRDLFAEFFGGGSGGGGGRLDTKSVDEFSKHINENINALKRQVPLQKQVEGLLRGQKQELIDNSQELEEFDKRIRKLNEAAKESGKFEDRQKVRAAESQREQYQSAVAMKNARAATSNFALGMTDVAQTLLKGAFQYAKDLQSGASGVEAGTSAATTAAKATGETISNFGNLISGLGPLIGGLFKKIPFLGPVISVAGLALDVFGKKAATVSEQGLQFLGDELKKTQKAFKEISDTGAVFGGGMTEMRQVAASAGLDIAQLSTVVKSSREDLVGMGLGLGEATKRIAGVSKELRTSDLGMQLRNLGYGAEEQAALAASLSARLSAAGDTRVRSDAEVARMTAQYGKDLKILSDVTGQDAKKAMEKARMQAMEQDLLSEAMAKGGPEAVTKLENQLASMPEALKKGYMEFVSSGGTAIADAATNVAITQNPKILEQYRAQYQMLQDQNISASQAMQRTLKANEETAEYARANAASTREVALASRFTGNQVTRGATDIYNSLIQTSARQRKGATEQAAANADAAAQNMRPLDVAVQQIEENAQKLRAAMGEELTTPITTFAQTMASATTTIQEALSKAGLATETKGTGEKVGEVGGALAGGLAGAAIGSVIPVLGTAIGGIVGSIVGGFGGSWLGGKMGKMFDRSRGSAGAAAGPTTVAPVPMAGGGIVDTPTRALIGEGAHKEAVIPLPNGRSIPLKFDFAKLASSVADVAVAAGKASPIGAAIGGTVNAARQAFGSSSSDMMQEQLTLLREISETLKTSNGLQQQYVYNTYT